MEGYLSFNFSLYFRTFKYCLKINLGQIRREKNKEKKKLQTICIMVYTIFEEDLKYKKTVHLKM